MVAPWVKELTESVMGTSDLAIGKRVLHKDGRLVEITGGQWWGEYGISNFWYWRPVLADGSLGEVEHGYGWR